MLERIKPMPDLVNEILDHLPEETWISDSTTFFDPAIGGGQFVREIERRLKEQGHTVANIRKRVFGAEHSLAQVDLAVNMYNLVGQYKKITYDHFFKLDNTMKFDVVVGNPPYQDPTGQNTLYPWFYSKAVGIVKDQGYLAMITPPAIIPGLWGVKDPDGIKMPVPLSIEVITIGDRVKQHFPKVSSEFCYFVLKNTTSNNTQVTVQTDAGAIVASGPIFPRVIDASGIKIAQSILNKCFSFYKDPYSTTSGDHGKSAMADPNGPDLAVEAISTDGQLKTRSITWLQNHPHYNKPKVIMPMYGKTAVIDYSHKLVSAAQEKTATGKLTGHNIQTILTNSDKESESLVSVLESRLQRFFNSVTNENRSQYINFLKNFVGVPLTQIYTDDTLEKTLKLTKKEQEWLCANF
jgi:hypothetical protein